MKEFSLSVGLSEIFLKQHDELGLAFCALLQPVLEDVKFSENKLRSRIHQNVSPKISLI